MANKYEIRYKHNDMPEEYVGKAVKWARDKEQAISFMCSGKPDSNGYCRTKKGARIQILSIEGDQCISQQIKSKPTGKRTTQDSAQSSLSL